MTAYYEQSIPVSRLSAKSQLTSSDILLVSEYNTESDSLYYTNQINAQRYGELISVQLNIQVPKDSTYDVSATGLNISSSIISVTNSLGQLSSAFLSNDDLTYNVPYLIEEKNGLSSYALSALRLERIIDHGEGRSGRFYLSAFAINKCRTHGITMLRFFIPPSIPGLSRHFTIQVSSDIDAIPVFVGDRIMFMTDDLPARIQANTETFYDFKEIRPNGFYVRMGTSPSLYEFDNNEVAIIYHMTEGANVYTLSLVASPAAGGTVTGIGEYACGGHAAVAASPSASHAFDSWGDGGMRR